MRWWDGKSMESDYSRRQWLSFAGAASLASLGTVRHAFGQPTPGEVVGTPWPSHALQATPKAGERRVPVVTALAVRPHDATFASAGDDHHVYLWDTREGCVLGRLEGHRDWILAMAYSPRGDVLATASNDRRVIFWNVDERRAIHELADARHVITQVAWSHDGRWIACIGFEDCLRIYDFESKQLARVLKCSDSDMRALAVSPDDRMIAAGGRNGVVRIWRLPEGTHALDIRPHHRRIRALNFSPDGEYLVSAGEDRWLHVHPVSGDEEGYDLPMPISKTLAATFYGPHHLATGGTDNLIRLWDLSLCRQVGTLVGHTGSVSALAATTSLLISGSFDTTVRLWTIVPNLAKHRKPTSQDGVRR
jgi:WD40 repeat protein